MRSFPQLSFRVQITENQESNRYTQNDRESIRQMPQTRSCRNLLRQFQKHRGFSLSLSQPLIGAFTLKLASHYIDLHLQRTLIPTLNNLRTLTSCNMQNTRNLKCYWDSENSAKMFFNFQLLFDFLFCLNLLDLLGKIMFFNYWKEE